MNRKEDEIRVKCVEMPYSQGSVYHVTQSYFL